MPRKHSQPRSPWRLRRLALLVGLAALLAPVSAAQADSAGAPAGGAWLGAYLDTGTDHSCALQRDRTVRCFGRGGAGRLGQGAFSNLLDLPGQAPSQLAVRGAAQVVTGDAHSCVRTDAGSVQCWGQGAAGQLGSRARDNRGDGTADQLTGTDALSNVPLGAPATQLSAGGSFTCALLAGGAVRCWGEGYGGRLGTSGEDNRLDGLDNPGGDEASTVPLAGAATQISAGEQHACALLATGDVQCWGIGLGGRLGQLGVDSRLDGVPNAGGADAAATVPLGAPAAAISAGGEHSCALMADGKVRCWGEASSGQLGAGGTGDRLDGDGTGSDAASTVPLRAEGAPNSAQPVPAVAISAGENHTCAVMSAPVGQLRCWGGGAFGQLGSGQTTNRLNSSTTNVANAATRVALGGDVVAVTAGGATTCALLRSGAVRCFGEGAHGSSGAGGVDARLDGLVDPASGTDDATSVPLGALPAAPGDLAPLPPEPAAAAGAPAAAPPPVVPAPPPAAPPAELAWKVKLTGKKATLTALLAPTTAGRCPKTVVAELKVGKTRLAKAKLKLVQKAPNCSVKATLKLRKIVAKSERPKLTLSGAGITRRVLTVRP